MLVECLSAQAYTPFLKFLSLRIWAFRRRLSFSFSSLFASSSRFFFTSCASWSQQQGRQSTPFYPIIYIYIYKSQPTKQPARQHYNLRCVYMWVYACAWCELGREKGRERDMRERESESGSTRFCYYCWCYYLYRYKQQETWKRGKIPLLVLLQAMTTLVLIALFHLVVIACYLLFLSLHHHTICLIVRKVEKWEEIHDH